MAVLLSPVGGVAGQFFDNNGNPLTGGKMYSYVAGTTTPQATYTSSAGTVAHSNPIILDAGGRVPGGEIWLTDGLQYKFVLKNANDVLIGTYDNIIGINSNFVNFLTETEVQTATAGQTVFTLTTMQYQPGTNNLTVYVDGVNQIDGSTYSYVETSSTVITFTAGLHVGALVKFTTAQTLSTGVTDASLVTYDPPFTNSVATTVEAKLAQTVSVLDFGADPTGTLSSDSAFSAAIAHLVSLGGGVLYFPAGTFLFSPGKSIPANIILRGQGKNVTIIKRSANGVLFTQVGSCSGFEHLTINGNNLSGVIVTFTGGVSFNYQYMYFVRVVGSASSVVTFDANTGNEFRAYACEFATSGALGVVGSVAVVGTESGCPRHFTNCGGEGSTLYDFSGANDIFVTGGYTNGIITNATASKLMANNLRIGAAAGTPTIRGENHTFVNCVWATPVILECTDSIFNGIVGDWDITDNGTGNSVFIKSRVYTPAWTASVANPSIGNGSIRGRFSREGNLVNVQMDIRFGSTTTFGTGTWSFSLPVPIDLDPLQPIANFGSGVTQDTGAGQEYVLMPRANSVGQSAVLFAVNTAGTLINIGSATKTWAGDGASLRFQLSYYTT